MRPAGHSAGLGAALLAVTLLAPLAANGAADVVWREVDPDNTVLMDIGEDRVVIELNPNYAPETVKHFKSLVRDGFYDALTFYRVIDGFVAQAGDGSDLGVSSNVETIGAEFEIDWSDAFQYVKAQEGDLYAEETGFIDGFAVGRDLQSQRTWLLHCPGVIAMARGEHADSSRTDFYIVIGQSPRHLDRNMNVFGRVVSGMEVVQRVRRGPPSNDGLILNDFAKSRIRRMTLASDIDEDSRMSVFVADTSARQFGDLLKERKNRRSPFFTFKPPRVLDACQVQVPARMTK